MTPEAYEQMWILYDEVRRLTPEQRQAFLDERCADDAELGAEIARLLAQAEASAGALLTLPCPLNVKAQLPPAATDPLLGRQVGPYEITKRIASGGMGCVYLAVRRADYKQWVAIKLIKHGMDTEEILHRFRTERQVLAGLHHPNIAQLLDGGTLDDRPYFVMEYIEGEPIDRYCRNQQLSTPERVTLFRSVCAAVHHAHVNGVLHRDLKPGNILVGGDGAPKLVDFGIAKLLNPELCGQTVCPTQPGWLFATPEYACPEQLRGGPALDRTTDVYALGVVLYELLTEHKPFATAGLSAAEIAAVVTTQPPTTPRHWQPRLARDLEAICLKCLRKKPAERYPTAAALDADLAAYLAGQPIAARPRSVLERGWRQCRRTPIWASLLVLVTLTILAGFTVYRWSSHPTPPEPHDLSPANHAVEMRRLDGADGVLRFLIGPDGEWTAGVFQDRTVRLWQTRTGAERDRFQTRTTEHSPLDRFVTFSPDSRRLVLLGREAGCIFDVATGKRVINIGVGAGDCLLSVAFGPEGKEVVYTSQLTGPPQGFQLAVYALAPVDKHFWIMQTDRPITRVAVSTDGRRFATVSEDKSVRLWALWSGDGITWIGPEHLPLKEQPSRRIRDLIFSPDCRTLAVAEEGKVTIWHVGTRQPITTIPSPILCMAYSPDSNYLVTGGAEGELKVWQVMNGREVLAYPGHRTDIDSVAYSPDGRRIVSIDREGIVRVWNAPGDP